MNQHPICDLADLAAAVPDGAKLVVPSDNCGVAMAATRELVRRGVRGLRLVCVPTSGLQAEILIGAGAIATLGTSAVTLGEFGPAHRFIDALRNRRIRSEIAETYPRFASTFANRGGKMTGCAPRGFHDV